MSRLTTPAKNAREEVIRDVAASVAAPALVSYVLWVLRRAVDLGIKRLYFVSRDGELLLEIASLLVVKLGLQLELRYLYGSRQAWHLPAIGLSKQLEEEWLFANDPLGTSVEIVLMKLGIEPSEIEKALDRHGFYNDQWRVKLNPDGLESLRIALSDPEIRDCIRQRAEKAREPMLKYLRQEGLMDPIPTGLVDLGWSGRMFDSLWAVLKLERSLSPCGFLFSWVGTCDPAESMTKEGYIYDSGLKAGYKDCSIAAAHLLEVICAGMQGMVCGYQEDEDCIQPVLTQAVNQYAQDWGLSVLRDTLRAFMENLCVNQQYDSMKADMRHAVRDLLSKFSNEPTRAESSVWGAYRHAGGQTESDASPLAQPYGLLHVLRRLLGRPLQRAGSNWHAASLQLTPSVIRFGIKIAARIRQTARPLLRTS
jgi:hypothetical protein